jgi:RNA ligase
MVKTITNIELYNNIQKEVEDGYINKKTNGDLELFNYSAQAEIEDHWTEEVCICRGIIFDSKTKDIVAKPFSKFFNYGQKSLSIPICPFEVTEKMDGSLGIAYYWEGDWHVATRGSFESDQAIWGTKWLRENVDTSKMIKGHTYLFEIIYKENRIVVDYEGFEGLVLIGIYNNLGTERLEIQDTAKYLGVRCAKVFSFEKFEDILPLQKKLSINEEGFVVRFENGYRVKIKGDEYCRVHKLISGVTPLRIWDIIYNGQDTDIIKKDLPDEFRDLFEEIEKDLVYKYDKIYKEAEKEYTETLSLTDKQIGLSEGMNYKPFVFSKRKNVPYKELKKGLLKKIKPKGNIL